MYMDFPEICFIIPFSNQNLFCRLFHPEQTVLQVRVLKAEYIVYVSRSPTNKAQSQKGLIYLGMQENPNNIMTDTTQP